MLEVLNENGKIILKGPLSEADVRNRNGRLYPKAVLREAIKKLMAEVQKEPKEVWSELEHPPYSELIESRACGVLKEVTWDESSGTAYCKVEVLPYTINGKKLMEMINSGSSIGISTRALGSLDEAKVVQPGLEIITGDIVAFPSCQNCYLTESTENQFVDTFIQINENKEENCNCVFTKLTLSEQMEVRSKIVDSIIGVFKK